MLILLRVFNVRTHVLLRVIFIRASRSVCYLYVFFLAFLLSFILSFFLSSLVLIFTITIIIIIISILMIMVMLMVMVMVISIFNYYKGARTEWRSAR